MSEPTSQDAVNMQERDALGIYGQPKKKRKRWLLKIISIVLIGMIIFIVFIPTILSSNIVREKILAVANENYDGTIEIDHLDFSWGGPCQIDGIRVKDSKGDLDVNVDRVVSSVGLTRLIISNTDLGELKVLSPVIHLKVHSSPEEAKVPSSPRKPAPANQEEGMLWQEELAKYNARCLVTDGQFQLEQFDSEQKTLGTTQFHQFTTALTIDQGTVQSDLSGSLDVQQPETQIKTEVQWTGSVGLGWQNYTLKGDLALKPLLVNLKGKHISQDQVMLRCEGIYSPSLNRMTLDKLKLSSQLATMDIAGSVTTAQDKIDLALDGKYETGWKELFTLIDEFAPDLKKDIKLQGRSQGEIRIAGPVDLSSKSPDLSKLSAKLGLGWDSAEIYGRQVGKFEMVPRLENNQILISPTALKVDGGTVQLAGAVDIAAEVPNYHLDQPLFVVDKYPVDYQLSLKVLSYINPLFSQVADIGGQVSLRTTKIAVPLSEKALDRLSVKGEIRFGALRIKPSGLLLELVNMADISSLDSIEIDPLVFNISNSRVHYDKMAIHFNRDVQLKFSGSVGLDEKIDLKMAMPVTSGLVKRLGVKGNVGQYLTALEDMDIVIPIRGTRKNPKLDLNAVNLSKLIEKSGKKIIEQKADDLIRDIIHKNLPDDLKKNDDQHQPSKPPIHSDGSSPQGRSSSDNKKPAKPKAEEVIIDVLQGLLKNR